MKKMISKRYINKGYWVTTGGIGSNPTPIFLANESFGIEWAFMVNQWKRIGFNWKNKKITFRGKNLDIPNMSNPFTKKLYSTYLSYLSEDKLSYELKMNVDNKDSFTEFIKALDRGQVSINIIKPGITKGNHWHHTKNEKFLVAYGRCFRKCR